MKRKKLPLKIRRLNEEIEELKGDLRYSEERKEALEGKVDQFEKEEQLNRVRINNRQETINEENGWLRNLVELITIPEDKLKKLDEIHRERMKQGY